MDLYMVRTYFYNYLSKECKLLCVIYPDPLVLYFYGFGVLLFFQL